MKIRDMILSNPILRISYTGIMIVVVFIFTVVFSLYIPETKGFFNIGESGVYIAAITGGPIVGGNCWRNRIDVKRYFIRICDICSWNTDDKGIRGIHSRIFKHII